MDATMKQTNKTIVTTFCSVPKYDSHDFRETNDNYGTF